MPIGVEEPFLRHILDRHADDVAAFNPPPEELLAADQHAFLIQTCDELVGVVLARAGAEPDEQQVVLDYVLPAYRDFTPGEFVFRPDGPFARLGARRVVASPAMLASARYLEAVGFHAEGDRQVLELDPR